MILKPQTRSSGKAKIFFRKFLTKSATQFGVFFSSVKQEGAIVTCIPMCLACPLSYAYIFVVQRLLGVSQTTRKDKLLLDSSVVSVAWAFNSAYSVVLGGNAVLLLSTPSFTFISRESPERKTPSSIRGYLRNAQRTLGNARTNCAVLRYVFPS